MFFLERHPREEISDFSTSTFKHRSVQNTYTTARAENDKYNINVFLLVRITRKNF